MYMSNTHTAFHVQAVYKSQYFLDCLPASRASMRWQSLEAWMSLLWSSMGLKAVSITLFNFVSLYYDRECFDHVNVILHRAINEQTCWWLGFTKENLSWSELSFSSGSQTWRLAESDTTNVFSFHVDVISEFYKYIYQSLCL